MLWPRSISAARWPLRTVSAITLTVLLALALFGQAAMLAAQERAAETTLLYLSPEGTLRMATLGNQKARLPEASLAPGKVVRRFAVSPSGEQALLETEANGTRSVWLLHLPTRRNALIGTGLVLPTGSASPFAPDGRRIALRRQNGDAVALYSVATRGLLHTLETPGIMEAPAWFGDATTLAVPVYPPLGGSAISLFDAVSGQLLRQVLRDDARVEYRCAGAVNGRLLVRERREGVVQWLGLRVDGDVLPVDEPVDPRLPRDVPPEVTAVLSPGGEWVAYVTGDELHLRASGEGAQAVALAAATEFVWKPGEALPEQPVAPAPTTASTPSVTGQAGAQLALQAQATEAVEGENLEITWQAGPHVAVVRLSAIVPRTPKGGASRGTQTVPIARAAAGAGRTTWAVPWLDNIRFTLRAEALDSGNRVLGRAEQTLSFRPRELAETWEDGIYVHLSKPERQRLYVQERGQLTTVYLCSGAEKGKLLPASQHPDEPHDHYGTFKILEKDADHISNLNTEWQMPFAMRYLGGHWIHVTARNQYYRLGRPGSHGCVRLHRADGMKLFQRTPIGTMVKIY